jgi:hypothetical protein
MKFPLVGPQEPAGLTFLQVPWELPANAEGHLAADPVLRY